MHRNVCQDAKVTAVWPSLLPYSQHDRADLRAVSAQGTKIRFADGRELLCATSGLWNVNLGYGNPAIASAIGQALLDASYLTLFRYTSTYAEQAAQALVDIAGPYSKVIFGTSGSSANDLTMKLARQYHVQREKPERKLIVSLHGSYHGLTYGGMSLISEDYGHDIYGVDRRLNRYVTANSVEELDALLDSVGDQVAAMFVEPVQGTGTVVLTPTYLEHLLKARDEHGFLLVADEVATGFGRTGPFYASGEWPSAPDVLITSKGLTNGTCAASAVLVSEHIAAAFTDDDAMFVHAETQAGTPASCAAIIATIAEAQRLLPAAQGLATRLDARLQDLLDHPKVVDVSGVGCFRSAELSVAYEEVPGVVEAIRAAGAVVHPWPRGFSLIPPLIYTDDDLDVLFGAIRTALA
ncbi:daptide-type RiPP biosynthesis aminotransferase [Pseudonocardia sp. TRM90224]|uniref:daptide-type RiPP biosynthesis aminotransferase n=1 Tax=Pseudonocardia sp. TRM90224 TaxID=2812678 RepID=UPI0021029040|nr:daptide-type RiPP biosynthesis aminotransferase [Pseudonocardia sp. TRM90224]